jgi:DNA-binding response OmpR family regulator
MQRPRVLVVEDDPLALMMLTLELQEDGFEVDGAESVHEARRHLAAPGYALDALVCDLDLRGGGDGYALARAARALNPAVAVLHASGVAQPEFEARKVAGAGLAQKPSLPQEIPRRLRGLLA